MLPFTRCLRMLRSGHYLSPSVALQKLVDIVREYLFAQRFLKYTTDICHGQHLTLIRKLTALILSNSSSVSLFIFIITTEVIISYFLGFMLCLENT